MEKYKLIPLKSIDKIELYENNSKLTVEQIVESTGCDFALTGLFYNTSWKPTCHLKIDGVVKSSEKDTYRGCAFDQGPDIICCRVPTESNNKKNHYACCALIYNGEPYPDSLVHYNSDVSGKRGRSGIGVSGENFVVYASTDGSKDAMTPEALRDYIVAKDKDIDWFIMGDGGSKVNFYGDGEYIKGSAKSQNLILVYLKKDATDHSFEIIQVPLTNNPRYRNPTKKVKTGYMQHSTAMPGVKARSVINTWNSSSAQAETEFVIDDTGIYQLMPIGIRTWHCGGSANNTHVGCEICEPQDTRLLEVNWYNLSLNGKNNTTYAVERLQKELLAWGYDPNGVDGIFGNGTKGAVVAFQKAQGLDADGIVGKGTLRALQKRKGSYLKYDPVANQAYFENVYCKAVVCCAYVLKTVSSSVDPKNVLSHAEGYKAGIASNHADIGHWWPEHGKSMDEFRTDVKRYIDSGVLPYGEKESKEDEVEKPVTEADLAWAKATAKGIFDGTNPSEPATRRQVAIVLNRLNLLD